MLHRFTLTLLCGLLLVSGRARAEEAYFKSDGVKIHYLIEGRGEPVVLIHGFTVNAQLQWGMSGIIKELAKTHRVIALDVRGHGKSDKLNEDKDYGTEMVEDVVRLLDHLKIKKAHVVGYSMGALITGKLLAMHPDRLLSATLGGAGFIPEGTKLPDFIGKLVDSLEKGEGIGPLLTALTPPGKPKPPAMSLFLVNRTMGGARGKQLAAVVRSWKNLAVSREQLRANKVPTLALIGSDDPLIESITIVKDDMANMKTVVIPAADHMNAFMKPKFTQTLQKFLHDHRQDKTEKGKKAAAWGRKILLPGLLVSANLMVLVPILRHRAR